MTSARIGRLFSAAPAYLAAIAGFAARSDRAWGGPVACAIEPTNLCNLRCPLCATGAGLTRRPAGFMSAAVFETILGRLPRSVAAVCLWGQGEPFLAPEFLDMVRLAAKRGLGTVTSTNGHFLDDPEAVAGSGLDTLVASLDGADEETYASYRVGGDFRKVVEGVRRLTGTVKKIGRGPEVRIQCLLTRANEARRDDIVRLARTIGARRVVFKTLQAASMKGGAEFLPDDRRFSRYRWLPGGGFEPDRSMLLDNRCMRMYASFQMDWRGGVVPCCFDKDSEWTMGNLLEESFESIWNSERYRGFRAMLNREGRVVPMCRDCTEGLRRMNIHA